MAGQDKMQHSQQQKEPGRKYEVLEMFVSLKYSEEGDVRQTRFLPLSNSWLSFSVESRAACLP